jgi:hypothetical protein
MKIELVYVYPVGGHYDEYAYRFLESYRANPPGLEHSTTIVCNGGPMSGTMECIFSGLPNCTFFNHDNSGYDIGAYQQVSRRVPCDMMVFFGSSAYLKRPGWMIPMAAAFEKYGPNCLYGSMGNQGNAACSVFPHIRTTGFWLSPALLNAYPFIINKPEYRYHFEHGQDCLTEWVKKRGGRNFVVGWSGEFEYPYWDSIPNGYHQGDQSAILSGDRVSAPPYYYTP